MNVLQQIRKQFKNTDKICSGFILSFNSARCAIIRKNGKFILFNYNKVWGAFVRIEEINTLNKCIEFITDYDPYKELNIEFETLSNEDLYYLL